MEIAIDAGPLKAMAHLSATADIRPVFNGVWLIVRSDDALLLASTGTVLGLYQCARGKQAEEFAVRIPPHVLATLKKVYFTVTISCHATGACEAKSALNTNTHWQHDWDEKYPNYSQVLVAEGSGVLAQYDPDVLVRFSMARKALGLKPRPDQVLLAHNGDHPARVSLAGVPEFVGAVSPLRLNNSARNLPFAPLPDWAGAPSPRTETTGEELA